MRKWDALLVGTLHRGSFRGGKHRNDIPIVKVFKSAGFCTYNLKIFLRVIPRIPTNESESPCLHQKTNIHLARQRSHCSCFTKQPLHCISTRWSRCQEDLNSFFIRHLEETTGMYSFEDYSTGHEIEEPLPVCCGSELSSTLEIDAMHSVVHASKNKTPDLDVSYVKQNSQLLLLNNFLLWQLRVFIQCKLLSVLLTEFPNFLCTKKK